MAETTVIPMIEMKPGFLNMSPKQPVEQYKREKSTDI